MKDKKQKESLKYLGAIGGLLAAGAAHGQIKYVDIADTTLNTNNAFWDLDIDEDTLGVVDYRFIQYVDTSIFNVSGTFIQARGNAGNSVMGLDYGNYAYPFNLSPGDSIGPGKPFKGAGGSNALGQLALVINDTGHVNDKFQGALNGLIGLRFRAEVNDTAREFFGWMRVDVAADYKSITIKDYAYQEQYGVGITAGEGSGWIGSPEFQEPLLQIQQLDQQLMFEIQNSEGSLEILSLAGAILHSEHFEKGQHSFNLDQLDNGLFIARLRSQGLEQSIRIVVY